MDLDLNASFKKWARNLMKSSQRRHLEASMLARYPQAERVLAFADKHITMSYKHPNGILNAHYDDNGGDISMLFKGLGDSRSEEEHADFVLASFIYQMERAGQTDPELTQLRQQIFGKLFGDGDGGVLRLTLNDLGSDDVKGLGSELLSEAVSFMEGTGLPYNKAVLDLLRANNTILKVMPYRSSHGMVGGYCPATHDIQVTYSGENATRAEMVAQLIHVLMHETAHLNQHEENIFAEVAKEADHYRELTHLNELQAHILQYKTALELFMASPRFDDFIAGDMSGEELRAMLDSENSIEDALIVLDLVDSAPGSAMLHNIKQRSEEGVDALKEIGSEFFVKEGLCLGQIDYFDTSGEPHYEDGNFTRMQRYAHSHIGVMNFGAMHSGGHRGSDKIEEIERAIKGHFNGDIGIDPDNIQVPFADEQLEFISAFTKRRIKVHHIEALWHREGGSEGISCLGKLSEDVMSRAAVHDQRAPSKAMALRSSS